MLTKTIAKTHEVQQWGIDNHYVTAERTARKLAEEGKLRRMTDMEVLFHYGSVGKEDVWIVVKGK